MKKRIAVVAFLLSMAVTSTAMADLSLGMGTRWTATRWYNPVWHSDVAGASGLGGAGASNHFISNSETALDAYFMLAFSKKFGLYLQVDYLSMSWACTSADNDDECTGRETGDMSFSSFGFELGMKYYFAEPRRAAISPMLTAGFYKYFGSVTDGDAPADDQFALSDLSSPVGGRLAIGVEYNFSNNFSIGAEIFGLRIAYASTSTVEETGDDRASDGFVAADSDTDYLSITMYTALTLNFRFYGLFRVYTREEEEQGRAEETEDRQENQQWQQQQGQGWQQDQGQQQNQQNQQNPNQQWQQNQQNPNQQWQQQQNPNPNPNPNQQWQQQPPPPQDPNQQWQQPQGGTPPPVQ
jgi:hypothetical protein